MSNARRFHASAAVGGKLYVFGGYGAGCVRLSTAEVYDPASDSWAQVSSLTAARTHLMAVAL
jgi:N-acetylneuraminic acid mutarotase